MTRSQTQTGCTAPAELAATAGRRRARGGGGRRSETDAKAATSAPRCWQSGAKTKAEEEEVIASLPVGLPAAASPNTASSPTAFSGRIPRGWAELPAAERASRRGQLEEMGFSASAAQEALEECDWDVNKALDCLFNGGPSKDNSSVPTSSRPTPQRAGGRTKTADNQARSQPKAVMDGSRQGTVIKASAIAPASAAGDSTSASGGSTPRRSSAAPTSDSPQQDVSSSSGDDLILLPPGLEEVPTHRTLLAAPPGLDLDDEPTPCPKATDITSSNSPQSSQVPSVVVPTTAIDRSVVPVSAITAPAGAVSVVPRRRLQKVQHTWQCEEPNTQMSVEEDTFVYVWSESKTETGWIYAESLICCSRAGWLPESMMQQLPPGRLWMRITTACPATFPMQLQVEAGNMVLVDASRQPVNGWVYAEQVASATGRPSLQGLLGAGGWVPIQCVEWTEV